MYNFQSSRKKIWDIVNKDEHSFSDVIEVQLLNMQFTVSLLSSLNPSDTKKFEEFDVFLNKSLKRLRKPETDIPDLIDKKNI